MAVIVLVTVKIPPNPYHKSDDKKEGTCPVERSSGKYCSDITGSHHTLAVTSWQEAALLRQKYHVTRVEEVVV